MLRLPPDVAVGLLATWLTAREWRACGAVSRRLREYALRAGEARYGPHGAHGRHEAWGWVLWHAVDVPGRTLSYRDCTYTPLTVRRAGFESEPAPAAHPTTSVAIYNTTVAYVTQDGRNLAVVHPARTPCFFALGFGAEIGAVGVQKHAVALAGAAAVRVVSLCDADEVVLDVPPAAKVIALYLHPSTATAPEERRLATSRCAVVFDSGRYAEYNLASPEAPHHICDVAAEGLPSGSALLAAGLTATRIGAVLPTLEVRIWCIPTECVLFEARAPEAVSYGLAMSGPFAMLRTSGEAHNGDEDATLIRLWCVGGGFAVTVRAPCAWPRDAQPCVDGDGAIRHGALRIVAPPHAGRGVGFYDIAPEAVRS